MSGWIEEECAEREGVSLLDDVAGYCLSAGGKRFRPVAALAAGDLVGVSVEWLKPICLALEYIHTFSLIHDDLPALDNDDVRRGRPTAHRQFGEGPALLAGDLLFTEAFKILADMDVPPSARIKLVELVAGASRDLCHGQMLDISASARQGATLADVKLRHQKKTGALIEASVLAPTCLLGEEELRRFQPSLEKYARHLGLLFQIVDDILDRIGTEEEMGRSPGSDQRRATPTYLTVLGEQQARELAEHSAEEARSALRPFGERAAFLEWLIDFVLQRNG
ncbi:MAG: polyprenyl synthetase family protein [Bdellovibrionales bacterium]|nr:polyprenyl synthetase family protein [Bdellovibrionales bacterium]